MVRLREVQRGVRDESGADLRARRHHLDPRLLLDVAAPAVENAVQRRDHSVFPRHALALERVFQVFVQEEAIARRTARCQQNLLSERRVLETFRVGLQALARLHSKEVEKLEQEQFGRVQNHGLWG